jgi:hypothetical protein
MSDDKTNYFMQLIIIHQANGWNQNETQKDGMREERMCVSSLLSKTQKL